VLIAAVAALALPAPARAEDEEPLIAWILDANWVHVEFMTVREGQAFALIGYATGGLIPYWYAWKEGEQTLSTIDVLTHSYSVPGYHVIVLYVGDMATQVATDTVRVTVQQNVDVRTEVADALEFAPPVPNPVRDLARLSFALPQPGVARLEVFDLAGRRVATLAEGDLVAGRHVRGWDLRDDGGRRVASGIYVVRLTARTAGLTRRLVVLR
jgi:hypothetical protein